MTRRARAKRATRIVEILARKGVDRYDAEVSAAESGGKGDVEGSAEGRALPLPPRGRRLRGFVGLAVAVAILCTIAMQVVETAQRLGLLTRPGALLP